MKIDLINTDDNWVYQSNKLIEASFSLTAIEQKLLRILASMIKKDDIDFKEYEFRVKDLMFLLGIKNNKNFYKEIDKIATLLMTRIVKIRNIEMKEFQIYHFVEVAKYYNGILKLKINPEMKPFYLNLDWYTKYQLKNILQFKSTYSFRFYELLKQYQNIRERTLHIEDIRLKLDIRKDEYPKYANLKQKVINPAIKEINEKTNITINFEDIKQSRRVSSIKFYIKPKNITLIETTVDSYDDSKGLKDIKKIIEENITDLEAKKILDSASGNIELVKEKYSLAKSTNKIEGIVGWLIRAIQEDWQPPKVKTIKSTFNCFKQREYDVKDLERKLLGWNKE